MDYRPKSTFELRYKKNKSNYYNFNAFKDINQSPKISSNKIRDLPEDIKQFSLLDINDKITNSKGTSLSKQYKRLTQDEINKQFGMDKLVGWRYNKLLITRYLRRIQTSKNIINKKNILNKNELPNIENKIDSNETKIKSISQPKTARNKESKSINEYFENEKNNDSHINNITNNLINNYNINNKNNLDKNEQINNKSNQTNQKNQKSENKEQFIYPSTKRNDRWMPKNFQNYDLLVKNPNILLNKLKDDSKKRKMPFLTSKEIKQKMNETDIFFVKSKKIMKNILAEKVNNSNLYTDSDIFAMKNDVVNLSKCGETYLFKSNSTKKYTSANESNSKWEPSSNLPNLVNYPSKEFNILCPDKKYYNNTRQKILENCKNKINNINNQDIKNIFFNPTHKQKGLSEFIDITQNGSGNPGREFVKAFKENPLCFQQNSDVCATYGDVHLDYRPTCTRPFIKDRF